MAQEEGWVYVAALRGKRGRGRVVVRWRGAGLWSGGCVEARMSAAAEQWWGGSQHWWQHHHNEGSYLLRERGERSRPQQRHGHLTLRFTDAQTSTVEGCLCFPSAAALRPACPESQDWTSFHTWDTKRQTHRLSSKREKLKGWATTWTWWVSNGKNPSQRERETLLNWARGK